MLRAIVFVTAFLLLHPLETSAQVTNLHSDEPIGSVREVYDGALMPTIQVNTFRNIDRLFSTRVVERGQNVYPLPDAAAQIESLEIESGGETFDLFDYVSRNRVSGLVAIKDGEIVLELYELANTADTRWMSMSVVKSMVATLTGAAIKDGHIESMDTPITRYLPQLTYSAYEGVTVRNLLQMASGVEWNETYTDPTSDRRHMLEVQISQEPGALIELMSELPRAADPGTRWNYSTGETQILAALVSAATERPVAQYLSEKIWSKFGMEADATWWLDSPGGLEIGGSGLSAKLRDYARFGLFLLNGGIAGGEAVLPEGWLEEATSPKTIGTEEVDYGYMLWPVPEAEADIHSGAFEARGIFGQRVYVNPSENVVVALWSARSKPREGETIPDRDFYAALMEAVR